MLREYILRKIQNGNAKAGADQRYAGQEQVRGAACREGEEDRPCRAAQAQVCSLLHLSVRLESVFNSHRKTQSKLTDGRCCRARSKSADPPRVQPKKSRTKPAPLATVNSMSQTDIRYAFRQPAAVHDKPADRV